MPPRKRLPPTPAKRGEVVPIRKAQPRKASPERRGGKRYGPNPREPLPTQAARNKISVEGRMALFLRGEITVEDMDFEELARGRFRDKNGAFTGRRPNMVPKEFHDACMREVLRRAQEDMTAALEDVVKSLVAIVSGPAENKDKIAASKVLMDRVLGKTPEKLEVKAKVTRFEAMLDKVIVDDDEEN